MKSYCLQSAHVSLLNRSEGIFWICCPSRVDSRRGLSTFSSFPSNSSNLLDITDIWSEFYTQESPIINTIWFLTSLWRLLISSLLQPLLFSLNICFGPNVWVRTGYNWLKMCCTSSLSLVMNASNSLMLITNLLCALSLWKNTCPYGSALFLKTPTT